MRIKGRKGDAQRSSEGDQFPSPPFRCCLAYSSDFMSARACSKKKIRTHTTKPQLHQNAQTGKHAAGEGIPCFSGRVEYTVYDRHKGDEVEGDGGCDGGTDEAKTEGSGTPYCVGGGRDGHGRGGENIPRR